MSETAVKKLLERWEKLHADMSSHVTAADTASAVDDAQLKLLRVCIVEASEALAQGIPKSLEGKGLLILTPMYGGQNTVNYFHAMMAMGIAARELKLPFSVRAIYNESLIARARNRLVDAFLKETTYSHCLFLDADIGISPADILSMLEYDMDIVGAPCVKKNVKWQRIQHAIRTQPNRKFTDQELESIGGDYVINFTEDALQENRRLELNAPREVVTLGTGCLMIKRSVFLKFKQSEEFEERWYDGRDDPTSLPGHVHDYFRTGINPDTRIYESEDYGFCQDARKIGFKIMVCPWIRTSHAGTKVYEGDLPAIAALTEV